MGLQGIQIDAQRGMQPYACNLRPCILFGKRYFRNNNGIASQETQTLVRGLRMALHDAAALGRDIRGA